MKPVQAWSHEAAWVISLPQHIGAQYCLKIPFLLNAAGWRDLSNRGLDVGDTTARDIELPEPSLFARVYVVVEPDVGRRSEKDLADRPVELKSRELVRVCGPDDEPGSV